MTFAGVIARPLYACTEEVDNEANEVCMNVASMSRFLPQPAGRPVYKCAKCSQEGAMQEPGSASPSLRILWAYPLVEGMDGVLAPLRVSSPVCFVVHAALTTWGWGRYRPRH